MDRAGRRIINRGATEISIKKYLFKTWPHYLTPGWQELKIQTSLASTNIS